MAVDTAIQWCDHTFNPWWGCARVSPACVHCYADTTATRYGHGGLWHRKGERRFFGDKHWAEPLKWDRDAAEAGVRRRVFCASMSDVFEQHPDAEVNGRLIEAREKLWQRIAQTPCLDWLLLTKRIEYVGEMVPSAWRKGYPPNVWLGTSVENQHYADVRLPLLLTQPAAVRFISAEPLLGPLTLRRPGLLAKPGGFCEVHWSWLCGNGQGACPQYRLDWVITGGESGKGHRPSDPEWFRSLRDQCVAAGVPFLFKQWGGATSKSGGRLLDGRTWDEYPQAGAAW